MTSTQHVTSTRWRWRQCSAKRHSSLSLSVVQTEKSRNNRSRQNGGKWYRRLGTWREERRQKGREGELLPSGGGVPEPHILRTLHTQHESHLVPTHSRKSFSVHSLPYRPNINALHNTNVLNFGTKKFCNSTQNRDKMFCFYDFFLRDSVLRSCCWLTQSKNVLFLCFFCVLPPFFLGGGYVSFSLVQLKRTWGTLDSGIAVHSYTGSVEVRAVDPRYDMISAPHAATPSKFFPYDAAMYPPSYSISPKNVLVLS